jgi:DNA primase
VSSPREDGRRRDSLTTTANLNLLDFESKKRQILDRVDILALVGEQVALRRTGKRWVGLCPFHAEKTPSFSVSPDMGIFKCFGCGKGGDIFSFVQFRENIPFMESMRFLADRSGVSLDEPKPVTTGHGLSIENVTRLDIGKACAWAQTFFRTNLKGNGGQSARQYLADRGFTETTVEQFGLGLASESDCSLRESAVRAGFSPLVLEAADLIRRDDSGRHYETFRNRLMFPIRDSGNRVIGFGGRTLVNDKAKYLNTRQNALFDKGRSLFGIDLARQSIVDRQRAIVVEGYTDCMACHQAGFTETVASLGTSLTETHVDLLRRYASEMVLVFDSDKAGVDAADRALRVALPRSITVRLARVPEGKDPGEFLTGPGSAPRFIELLKDAVEALEFTWRQTWARYHSPTSDARRQEAVLDFVRMVCEAANANALDAIRKGLLVNQLAHLLRLDRAEVVRLMASQPSGRAAAQNESIRTAEKLAAPRDAEQGAWVHLLEVLLNEPGLLGSLSEWPDTARIIGARDRRIAEWIFDCARNFGDFTLTDVLARAQDGDDAARIAELATRGQAVGNFEASFQVAVQRLKQYGATLKLDSARRSLMESPEGEGSELEVYADGVRRHRHFGPLRLVRQAAAQSMDGNTATTQAPLKKTNSEPL